MNKDVTTSIIRTVVPSLVGFVAAILLKWGIDIDQDAWIPVATVVISNVYYAIIRIAENKHPKAGKLLGVAKTPTYNS